MTGGGPLAGDQRDLGHFPTPTVVTMSVHQFFSITPAVPNAPGGRLGLAGRVSAFGCSHQGEAYLVNYPDEGGFGFPFAGCQLAGSDPTASSFSDIVLVSGTVRYGYTFDSACPFPDYACATYQGGSGIALERLRATLAIAGDSVRGGVLNAFPGREYLLRAEGMPDRMGRFFTPILPVGTGWSFTPDSSAPQFDICDNGSGRTCTMVFDRAGLLTLRALVNGEEMVSTPLRVQPPVLSMTVSADSASVGDTVMVTTTVAGLDSTALSYYAVTTYGPTGDQLDFAFTEEPGAGPLPPCLGTKPAPRRCFVVLRVAGRAKIEVGAFLDKRGLSVGAQRFVVVRGGDDRSVIIQGDDEPSGNLRMRPSEIIGIKGTQYVSTKTLRVSVIDGVGRSIPNAVVTLSLSVDPFSGGHGHADPNVPRPAGTLGAEGAEGARMMLVNTGIAGEARVRYQAPDASGLVTVHGGSPGSRAGARSITIAYDGLVLIEEIPGTLQYVGAAGAHHGRFWAKPIVRDMLMKLADTLSRRYPSVELPAQATAYLGLNDASLVYGGQFDIRSNWLPPHADHRRGQGADLRTIDKTKNQVEFMKNYWELTLGGAVYDETGGQNPAATGPHYHFKECKSCAR